jgi:putative PIN family toxin of toxin-antitoxin system
MNTLRPAVVFDCNIFLQGLIRRTGPSAEALRFVERNEVTLYVSRSILRELRSVLGYPEIRLKNPNVTDEIVEEFIGHIAYRGVLIGDVPQAVKLFRDVDDEPYLNLAAIVRADYLVTRDHDLLDLATTHTEEAKDLRRRFPSLKIVNPVRFLGDLKRTTE